MMNPLFKLKDLPHFSEIQPEHVKPAVQQTIDESREGIERLLEAGKNNYTWDSLQEKLDVLGERLSQVWSPVSHLNNVVNTPELRQVHDDCLPELAAFNTWLGQNTRLYEAYKTLSISDEFETLEPAQKKIITDSLRDFRLAGVALAEEKKKRFAEIQQNLSRLTSQFFGHVLDATMAWTKSIEDINSLSGIPQSSLELLRKQAKAKGKQGYLLTLDFPNYHAVITYCDNRALRQEMYTAYTTRASDQGPFSGKYDNSEIMREIIRLRQEMAELLGFASYADYSLATKMASSPKEVMEFLQNLAKKSHNQAKKEFEELSEFAKAGLGDEELKAWDIAYFSEKLRQQQYAINQEALRPWFPVDKVLKGLFSITETLFGVTFKRVDNVNTWHSDVLFYEIERDGQLIGQFYADLYAREHKRDGAWMDSCRNRWKRGNKIQTPVAFLTCNFAPPLENRPALLTHDDVVTLFHEFGHTIHHLLTQINYPDVAGINGVPWDAVELPSQFMENWCWQKEAVQWISAHYETGEPLPEEKLEKLLEAKNFHSGMFMVRQLEFALFDMKLHMVTDPDIEIQEVLDNVRKEVAVIIPPEFNRFQHAFSHIFDGGYAAGYYSYLWAEVLSADAFSAFEEEGIFNSVTGQRFWREILSQGGSREPEDMFEAFRGRKPDISALLRHKGIK